MRLLLTGFEPFGGGRVNPSQRIVEALAKRPPKGVELSTLVLPVVGGVAPRRLLGVLTRLRPEAVVMLGESGASAAITLERVAVNLRDYRIADNAGRSVRDRPVVRQGPAAYFATLPLRRMQEAMAKAGVPAVLSTSAGTFLCNEVMYAALHALRTTDTPCGFIHVPRLPEQVLGERGAPSMDEALAVRGIEEALCCLCGRRGSSISGRQGPDRVTLPGPTSPSRRPRRPSVR